MDAVDSTAAVLHQTADGRWLMPSTLPITGYFWLLQILRVCVYESAKKCEKCDALWMFE